jgi:hypothetical protein
LDDAEQGCFPFFFRIVGCEQKSYSFSSSPRHNAQALRPSDPHIDWGKTLLLSPRHPMFDQSHFHFLFKGADLPASNLNSGIPLHVAEAKAASSALPDELSILPLRNTALFPGVVGYSLGRDATL